MFNGNLNVITDFADRDKKLLRRIAAGDKLAFNTLFTCYYQRLCRFACTLLSSNEEAEEVASDMFFVIWEKASTLEIRTNLRSYLYSSVRYACLSRIGRRKLTLDPVEQAFLNEAVPSGNNIEDELCKKELEAVLTETVDLLPPRCREVYLLSREDGLSYREIGEILNITEKTVENHLVRALNSLRSAIARHNGERSSGVYSHNN
jgi:RNA polymerase sigma-70 factor, ECF subfamily